MAGAGVDATDLGREPRTDDRESRPLPPGTTASAIAEYARRSQCWQAWNGATRSDGVLFGDLEAMEMRQTAICRAPPTGRGRPELAARAATSTLGSCRRLGEQNAVLTLALPNAYFAELGLPRLQMFGNMGEPFEPPHTDPYVRWRWSGGAPRTYLYPDLSRTHARHTIEKGGAVSRSPRVGLASDGSEAALAVLRRSTEPAHRRRRRCVAPTSTV